MTRPSTPHKMAYLLVVLPLSLAIMTGFWSCGGKTYKPLPSRSVKVEQVSITGQWKDYISIEDGEYFLEDLAQPSSFNTKADAHITIPLSLKKTYSGSLESPAATFRLDPLTLGGSAISSNSFTISTKDKFNEFVRGNPGDTAKITFRKLYIENDVFNKIASFEGSTVDPPKTASSSGNDSGTGEQKTAPMDTRTDPNFNARTAARIGPRVVAVPEFTGTQSVPKDVVTGITGAAITGLMENSGVIRVVDYNQIERIMRQHNFEASVWSNPAKYAEIGKALNVDTIAIGTITFNGKMIIDNYSASMQLIDISTMSVVGACTTPSLVLANLTSEIQKGAKSMKVLQ